MNAVKIEENFTELAEQIIETGAKPTYQVKGIVAPVGTYVFRLMSRERLSVFKCLDFSSIEQKEGTTLFKAINIKSELLKISCSKRIWGPNNLEANPDSELILQKAVENAASVLLLLTEVHSNGKITRYLAVRFDKYQNTISKKYFDVPISKAI
jgi:hypothetical protein